jgi:hypothetical protein
VDETQRRVARQKAREILARMRTDSGFIEQLQANPRGTLAAAGMPADVLDEAVSNLDLDTDEVTGQLMLVRSYRCRAIWQEARETP